MFCTSCQKLSHIPVRIICYLINMHGIILDKRPDMKNIREKMKGNRLGCLKQTGRHNRDGTDASSNTHWFQHWTLWPSLAYIFAQLWAKHLLTKRPSVCQKH